MKARLFVLPSVLVVLIALAFAQQPAPQGQGQQGQVRGAVGRNGFGRGGTPTFPGPPAGNAGLAAGLVLIEKLL